MMSNQFSHSQKNQLMQTGHLGADAMEQLEKLLLHNQMQGVDQRRANLPILAITSPMQQKRQELPQESQLIEPTGEVQHEPT